MLEQLKSTVCEANLELVRQGLVTLTWGNVSGIDRASGLVVIKPSGVSYDRLTPDVLTVVDWDGQVIEGKFAASTDTATHLCFYRAFPNIGGAVHTHSTFATAFAQASREIPCLGTTHADHFFGSVPVARMPTAQEVAEGYEMNIGKIIAERFKDLDPDAIPGVLAAGHGPFTWGPNPKKAVENAVALEAVAQMASIAFELNPVLAPLPQYLLDKHYMRKHGPGAYYGQK
ncbi:MAG: L-ribulose-5-phosphate 4-epimerase AraD [bacterium]